METLGYSLIAFALILLVHTFLRTPFKYYWNIPGWLFRILPEFELFGIKVKKKMIEPEEENEEKDETEK